MIENRMIAVSADPVWNPVSIPEAPMTIEDFAARTATMAVRALLREAEAGPKPGLVDRFGPGVHTDMDISHFRLSAAALEPFFEAITLESAMFMAGMRPSGHGSADGSSDGSADGSARNLASLAGTLRKLGRQAESAMLAATGGVNTHKGAIWTIGLLCASFGSLIGYRYRKAVRIFLAIGPAIQDTTAGFESYIPDWREAGSGCMEAKFSYLNAEAVCIQAARLAEAILSLGLDSGSGTDSSHNVETSIQPFMTNGLAARQAYGLRSARDEALEGFPSIKSRALPLARNLKDSAPAEEDKVISVLLAVMCELDDTCIVARGGLPALRMAQAAARQVLDSGGPFSGDGAQLYRKMVADFQNRRLSPGGSADLCAATLFLAEAEAWLAQYRLAQCRPDRCQ